MSAPHIEKHRFEAEVDQVLSIVVNSLYSHREVFLRELISNSSDALDKLAFAALTDGSLLGDDPELKIHIEADAEQRTLTIRDNGVGMSHDDLISHLGTIARSGSKQLVEALAAQNKASGQLNLIGQFGVGFYSAFLVADRVTVTSQAAGSDEAWRWESDAKSGYTVEPAERDGRGTDIVLHLKEDADEFVQTYPIERLVRKYSDYVRHPIMLRVERSEPIENEKDDKGKPKYRTVLDWKQVNEASALWTRPKTEIEDSGYAEFYKHLSHDWTDPLAWTHFKVEGTQELTGLLFIPSNPPMDLFDRNAKRGVRLFVKRVFIMEDCEELLPEWLRFARGVIDSQDLPLNVSREVLQQDRVTRGIKKQVTRKVLDLLDELAKEGETTIIEQDDDGDGEEKKVTRNRYELFWRNFGRILKEGIHFEPEHKDRIAALLRFESSRGEGLCSLHDYVARMGADQPGIYFITGDSIDACRNSPHLEALRKRDYEVLFLADPVDEWVTQSLTEFEDKKLIAATKGALDLPESDDEKQEKEERAKELTGVLEQVKAALETSVKEVRLTNRLTDSPACLVAEEWEMSPHLERILRASGQEVPEQKRILELNPQHPVVQRLERLASDAANAERVSEWSALLFDQALLAEGTMPKHPAEFAKRVARLMAQTGEA